MDVTNTSTIRSTLMVIVLAATIILLFHTNSFSIGLCITSFFYPLAVFLRDYIFNINLQTTIGRLYIVFQFILSLVIIIWSESFFAQIYVMILIAEFTFYHSLKRSFLFTTISYVILLIGVVSYRDTPFFEDVYLLLPRVIDFYAIFGMSHFASIAMQQKLLIEKDNEILRQASIELEKKAKLQERTRISREIHDAVGHTLTAALVGLQTAEHAVKKNNTALAQNMLVRTRESIQQGLDNVRSSIHLLRENIADDKTKFNLITLINDTVAQTNIDITYNIDSSFPDLPPIIDLTIYRALQEGLTNGIKHGASTNFIFNLHYNADNGLIEFDLKDNGKSPFPIFFGFGLTAMTERVHDIGGVLTIEKNKDNHGTSLSITIPYKQRDGRSEKLV